MARVLVVEDDPAIALGLVDALNFEGHDTTHVSHGSGALEKTAVQTFDCVLLDVMLPDVHGYELCEQLRARDPSLGIVMLTARGQESDKIRGLNAGADDYVTKPFSVGEVMARINALMRRRERKSESPVKNFSVGIAQIDINKQTIITVESSEQALSFHEAEVLRMLHAHRGHVVPREDLLREIWGSALTGSRSLDNVVAKLRKHIEKEPADPEWILTAYGVGYKLVAE